ncbi:hypothetical protein C3709_20770 [Lelliottia aquatilis]|uniref:Uncharacterized protein n=1 Tax=Lelliottia aquatilis TaxID=2080838 RepID=A0ABX4ZVY7_9ENTR|nr:hypothetical protein [Lelliottia aquatilis]POZ24441.1 hypothetical protein C3708_14585 [Lelliottia sp. 7254-16]UQC70107.1 hypothetical protein C0560_04630 [Lelliottia sp. AC1]POZ19818.1 hypothetical protein C3712_21090 [Lelliottia aquatilis]POZ21004.1 hypothetical protein C3711_21410 [Lelliottia aquatilis]
MILPFITQHLDSLRLWQFWHKQGGKTRLARKRSKENPLSVCFFTDNYSPLFTFNKNISNTVC